MKTYYIMHNLGRAHSLTADADAICQRVNSLTASNGDSLDHEQVRAELDAICSAADQALMQISLVSEDVEIEDE